MMNPEYTQPSPSPENSSEPQPPERGLSMMECLVVLLVGLIPLAGPVVLCVWSFRSKESPAKRALARAFLIIRIVLCLLLTSVVVQAALHLARWFSTLDYFPPDFYIEEPYGQPDLPDDWEYYLEPWGDLPEDWDGTPFVPCDPDPLSTQHL